MGRGRTANEPPPVSSVEGFPDVFREERRVIGARRRWRSGATEEAELSAPCPPENLAGLALSGGGIRSATYCLGLLQGLAELKLLRAFDYVSTVSGGGYIGGWWSAWLSREEDGTAGGIFPAAEGNDLLRSEEDYIRPGPARGGSDFGRPSIPEGSASAAKDPIHHLRLYANYLTPRRGLLSFDTWRAATFVSRNLVLTWAILIPVLAAVVLTGQLYYTAIAPALSTGAAVSPIDFPIDFPAGASSKPRVDMPERTAGVKPTVADWLRKPPTGGAFLTNRAVAFLVLPALLLAAVVLLAGLWVIRNQGGRLLLALVGAEVSVIVLFFFVAVFFPPSTRFALPYVLTFLFCLFVFPAGIGAQALWTRLARPSPAAGDRAGGEASSKVAEAQWRREVYRNQLARIQARLLLLAVLSLVVLGFSGFGHELVAYACCHPLADGSTWLQAGVGYVAKTLSLSLIVGSLASLAYTWWHSAPVGGGDQKSSDASGAKGQLVLALTPPLTLIALCLLLAWVCHALLSYLLYGNINPERPQDIGALTLLIWLSVGLCFLYGVFEFEWPGRRPGATRALLLVAALAGYFVAIKAGPSLAGSRAGGLAWLAVVAATGLALIIVPSFTAGREPDDPGFKLALILLAPLALAAVVWAAEMAVLGPPPPPDAEQLNRFIDGALGQRNHNPGLVEGALSGLTCCGAFFLFALSGRLKGGRENGLVTAICAAVYTIVGVLLVATFSRFDLTPVRAAVALAATCLGWVVSLGWLVDPNALSMHSFYRARLVRAYLGASNPARVREEITEAAEGDDMLLTRLANERRGAPLHLINTTLNLVGSRDLATAQRSSAIFTLSKLFCGSPRTGYRPTSGYMRGGLSLGTAVAVSGAAVSPNMGALKTGASVAMVLTLLNVRLGFWAPTPNRGRWRSPQARLWPYYTFREFLSETNDLSSYCYLTDGGHFDNTGLYSLVQRGCRFIVVADCGADPRPCFQDLGDSIRRCRIDFGAEVELDVSPLVPAADGRVADPCVVGTVTYSEEHARLLGWADGTDRKGYVILFKPSLPPDVPADVWQYKQENPAFPHQTTADQWYDEAQFESYRRLGLHCANSALRRLQQTGVGNWGDKRVPTEAEVEALFIEASAAFTETKSEGPRPGANARGTPRQP